MTRVVHCSDLHFGDHTPALATALRQAIMRIDPDVVVISGDMTQRARRRQFLQAAEWVQAFDCPVMTVPGNHDLPLLAPWKRAMSPRKGFRRYITPVSVPFWQNDLLSLHGVDSTRCWRWKDGGLGRSRRQRTCEFLGHSTRNQLHMLVLHHPLPAKKAMRWSRGSHSLEVHCRVDVVLAGHMHTMRIDHLPEASVPGAPLQLVAGTALSKRTRGEPNSFFVLDIATSGPEEAASPGMCLRIIPWVAEGPTFYPGKSITFHRTHTGWEVQPDSGRLPCATSF